MHVANLHGPGVITKLHFVSFAAFKELATLNRKPVYCRFYTNRANCVRK